MPSCRPLEPTASSRWADHEDTLRHPESSGHDAFTQGATVHLSDSLDRAPRARPAGKVGPDLWRWPLTRARWAKPPSSQERQAQRVDHRQRRLRPRRSICDPGCAAVAQPTAAALLRQSTASAVLPAPRRVTILPRLRSHAAWTRRGRRASFSKNPDQSNGDPSTNGAHATLRNACALPFDQRTSLRTQRWSERHAFRQRRCDRSPWTVAACLVPGSISTRTGSPDDLSRRPRHSCASLLCYRL